MESANCAWHHHQEQHRHEQENVEKQHCQHQRHGGQHRQERMEQQHLQEEVRPQHRHRRGHPTRVFLDIHPLRSTSFIVIWSSPRRSLDAIIVHQDPRAHHHLLSEIISHTIAYIINASTTMDAACRSSPSINIQTTLLQQQPYQPPQQHHNNLIERLEGSIEQVRRLAGKTAFTSADLNELCKTSMQLINRDQARHQSTTSRLDRQQPPQLRDLSTSSSSALSSYNNRGQQQPHLEIRMIECNNDIAQQQEVAQHRLPDHRHHHQQDSQPLPGYRCHIVFDISDSSKTYIEEPLHYQPSQD